MNWRRRRRALKGRYPFIAQGASPGLIIKTYLLSPKGAALPRRKANARVVVPLLRSSFYFCPCVPPGFHFGLCPYCTLGYARVSPLQGSSTLSPPINNSLETVQRFQYRKLYNVLKLDEHISLHAMFGQDFFNI